MCVISIHRKSSYPTHLMIKRTMWKLCHLLSRILEGTKGTLERGRQRSYCLDHALSACLYLGKTRKQQCHPTPVLLPGKSHRRRSLVGCSPWGHEESDMTERLHFEFSLSCTGEGNGTPLQCSCLGNPMDRGAWWAIVHRVTKSWTRLKQLSRHIQGGY